MDFISGNIKFYSKDIGFALFWGAFPVALVSSELALCMWGAAFLLQAVRLVNNKLSFGRWF